MDSKFRILLSTFFKGCMTTKDVYALIKFIANVEPIETVFSNTDNGDVFVDFRYDDGMLASDYLEIDVCRVEEYKNKNNTIAKEITSVMLINDDLEEYIKQSKTLKKFLKLYKKNNALRKATIVKNQQKRLRDIGIDDDGYDFIKDIISINNMKN